MYSSDHQIHLIRFFSLFNAKTGYGRLDTAKSLANLLWSLSRSRSPKLWNVSESERSLFSRSRSGVGVKISDSVHLCCLWKIHCVSDNAVREFGIPCRNHENVGLMKWTKAEDSEDTWQKALVNKTDCKEATVCRNVL